MLVLNHTLLSCIRLLVSSFIREEKWLCKGITAALERGDES